MKADLARLVGVKPIVVAGLAGLALAVAGCGAQQVRTVTVQRTTAPPASPKTAARSDALSRRDNARVATARVTLHDYCAARESGSRPDEDSEVAALVVLTTIFVRHPNAVFSPSDESLALADVLKLEATQLDQGRCDPKGAKLLRNAVDAGIYGGGRY